MNIFIDGLIFGRQRFGGISRVWEEYLTRMPDYGVNLTIMVPIRKNNSSLKVLLQNNRKLKYTPDYFYWPARFFQRISFRSQWLQLHIDRSFQIFHSTYYSTIFDQRIKKFVTIHDMIPERFPYMFSPRWTPILIETKKCTMENADHIIAVSSQTKTDILHYYPHIQEEKITVIHHGVTLSEGTQEIKFEIILRKYFINIQPFKYFLFVGVRNGYKNFKLLIDLLTDYPSLRDLKFVCVGGEKDKNLSAFLEEKRLSSSFIFLDFIPDNELKVLYRNALAFIYPSIYEGFGLPILEAMANDCPVICSNSSCFPEIAGDAACFFDPNSVSSLYNSINDFFNQDRIRLIAKGKQNLIRFSWDKSTQALVETYQHLL